MLRVTEVILMGFVFNFSLSTLLFVLCALHISNAAEVRCASSAREWCRINEPVSLTEGEKLTILNSDHKDTASHLQWTMRSHMKTIPAAIFETFPKLLMLDLGTGIEELNPTDFEKASVLEHVELSKNRISRVPVGVFTKATKLRTIDMTNNQITEIEENAFNGLNQLEEVIFEFNYITSLKRNTFAGARKLRTINLRSNEIATIESGTFNLPHLDELDLGINHLKMLSLPTDLFVNAPILRHVDLAYNELTEIPVAVRRNKVTIESLVLDYNQLDDFEFSELLKIKPLKYVSLENTGFVIEDDVLTPQKASKSLLDNIDLTANGIATPNILKHLAMFVNLETITLNENHIHRIIDIGNVKTIFPNITTISLENNEVDCTWLREILPAMKAAEIDLATGTVDEKIPAAERGESVDDQLCGKVPQN